MALRTSATDMKPYDVGAAVGISVGLPGTYDGTIVGDSEGVVVGDVVGDGVGLRGTYVGATVGFAD